MNKEQIHMKKHIVLNMILLQENIKYLKRLKATEYYAKYVYNYI